MRQAIVWGEKEVEHLISALSWITIHGNEDNALSFDKKTYKALHSKLIVTCGYASLWGSEILRNKGIRNRIVSTLTLDEWNLYDNGHTMLEVWEENLNKWVVYDIDNGKSFFPNQIK